MSVNNISLSDIKAYVIGAHLNCLNLSINNICFYKENQKEHHWKVPHEVLC